MGNRSNIILREWYISVFAIFACMLLMACSSSNKKTAPKKTLLLVNESATAYLEDTLWVPERESEIRGRIVKINPVLFTHSDTLSQGNHLLINLFEDEHFNAVITRSTFNSAGILSISGKLSGQEGSWFTMSLDSSRLLANVYVEGQKRRFAVYYSGEISHHVVVERDLTLEEALQEHPPILAPDTLNDP